MGTVDGIRCSPYQSLLLVTPIFTAAIRYISGEDSSASLTSRAALYSARVEWIYANERTIVDMIKTKMLKT